MNDINSQRVAKNTFYLFIRMFVVLLVNLYISRVILEVLGFEDFGIYTVVGSVVVFLSFLKMALTNATYRFFAYEIGTGNTKKLTEIYSMAINCHIILAIAIFLILETGGLWFLYNKLIINPERIVAACWTFQFSLATFCVAVIQTPFNSNIIAHERMDFYALVSVAEVVLKLLFVFLLKIWIYDKLIFYGISQFVIAFLIMGCYYCYCNYIFKDCHYIRYWDNSVVKQFASYSGWALLVNASDVIAIQCISIFINLFCGLVSNAAMGITQQVNSQLNAFLGNFTQAINPQIIKSYAAKQYDYFMKLIFSSSKISYFLFLLVSLPLLANIEYILGIWLGEYPPETPAFIRVFVLCSIFEASQNSFLQAVHATGRIKIHQILMSSIKLSSIPVMYFVMNNGGSGKEMLSVWALFTFLWCTVRLFYMHFLIGLSLIDYFKNVILRLIIISMIVVPITIYLAQSFVGIYAFFTSSLCSTFLLLILVWLYGLNSSERDVLKGFARSKMLK